MGKIVGCPSLSVVVVTLKLPGEPVTESVDVVNTPVCTAVCGGIVIAGFVPDADITKGEARKSAEVEYVSWGLEIRRILSVAESGKDDVDLRSPEGICENCEGLAVLDGFAMLCEV